MITSLSVFPQRNLLLLILKKERSCRNDRVRKRERRKVEEKRGDLKFIERLRERRREGRRMVGKEKKRTKDGKCTKIIFDYFYHYFYFLASLW